MKKYPKIGIRPTIDGRQGGVRESLEEKTMSLAKAVAELITSNLKTETEVLWNVSSQTVLSDVWLKVLPVQKSLNAKASAPLLPLHPAGAMAQKPWI